ncbi:beta-lactamase-like protein [Aspergillus aurantiobrunneus]
MRLNEIQFPPYLGHTVKVYAINGAKCQMRADLLVHPPPVDDDYLNLVDYSFLIVSEHRGQRVLYDLAFMKDLERHAPPAVQTFVDPGQGIMRIQELHHVPDTLQVHGLDLSSINALVWSHAHIDHVGDPSVFPSTTTLVVGPGCKTTGYPQDPTASILDTAFQNRTVQEMDFETADVLTIGGFRAVDYFNDGSFFILYTPGHTMHHMSALCRTTPSTWMLLAGDICHSAEQMRARPPLLQNTSNEWTIKEPLYGLAPGIQENLLQAKDSLEKLKAFDNRDDVMVLLAHDASLLDVLEFYPNDLNDWKTRGWADNAWSLFLNEQA